MYHRHIARRRRRRRRLAQTPAIHAASCNAVSISISMHTYGSVHSSGLRNSANIAATLNEVHNISGLRTLLMVLC